MSEPQPEQRDTAQRQKEMQEADPISTAIIQTMNKIREHKYVPRETMGDNVNTEVEQRRLAEHYKAHAERLAEALKKALPLLQTSHFDEANRGNQIEANDCFHASNLAQEALSAWEGRRNERTERAR